VANFNLKKAIFHGVIVYNLQTAAFSVVHGGNQDSVLVHENLKKAIFHGVIVYNLQTAAFSVVHGDNQDSILVHENPEENFK
jgi:hypothetical protein